jgi:hypothetical protein
MNIQNGQLQITRFPFVEVYNRRYVRFVSGRDDMYNEDPRLVGTAPSDLFVLPDDVIARGLVPAKSFVWPSS